MDKDLILKASILHIGGYLVRNAIIMKLGGHEHGGHEVLFVNN